MAKITINNNIKHKINTNIYSHFIEEIGEAIHDGMWTSSEHLKNLPHSDDPTLSGVRADLFHAMEPLFKRPNNSPGPLFRWPGGNFVETYHWENGIGPREDRKGHPNKFWGKYIPYGFFRNKHGIPGPYVHNQFGTDEFNILCKKINAEPYININYGTGTVEEAANWVEYCNGPADTPYGALRAKTSPEPYKVKYWGIANEIWGRYIPGYEKHPAGYARRYLKFARAMKQKDPEIKLVASGIDPAWKDLLITKHAAKWNSTLLKEIEGYVDYLSIHIYAPWTGINIKNPWVLFGQSLDHWQKENVHYAIQAAPEEFKKILHRCWDTVVEALGPDTHVRLALDEWNVWYQMSQAVKSNASLSDSLFVASILLLLQRLGSIVTMGSLAQLINCLGIIRTDDRGIVKTPSYHVFEMIYNNSHPNYLSVETTSPTFKNQKYGMVEAGTHSCLDVGATISDDYNHVTVFVVNRHFKDTIEANIQFNENNSEAFTISDIAELSHSNPFALNTPENRENIVTRQVQIDQTNLKKRSFPPHSITMIKLSK